MTRTVSFGDIHLDHQHWRNPRRFTGLSDKELGELAADIDAVRKGSDDPKKTSGIIDPPKVVMVKSNGSFINLAIDGQRRLLAAQLIPLPKNTPIEVVDLVDEPIDLTPEVADDLMLKALRMFNREPLSSWELAEVALSMRARDRELKDIADAIHKSESWVSRMLKAMSTATPKLIHAWKKGEITDEAFKELAAQKDAERQEKDTEEVIEARKSGDKTEARTKAKEVAETVKQKKAREKAEREAAKAEAKAREKAEKAAKKGNGKKAAAPADAAPSVEWTPPPEKPAKKSTPPKVVLEEIVSMAEKRPPTHDLVKGIVAGIAYATGNIDQDDFGKPWHAWVARVAGATAKKAEDKPKPSKPLKRVAKAEAKAKAKPKAKPSSKKPAKAKAKKKR